MFKLKNKLKKEIKKESAVTGRDIVSLGGPHIILAIKTLFIENYSKYEPDQAYRHKSSTVEKRVEEFLGEKHNKEQEILDIIQEMYDYVKFGTISPSKEQQASSGKGKSSTSTQGENQDIDELYRKNAFS